MVREHPALEITDLVRRYDNRAVVDGVSLQVGPAEVVVLVGPNGCGKTTSVETAIGLRRADGGSVRISGSDPWKVPQRELARLVGVQLQRGALHAKVRLGEHGQQLDAAYGQPGRFAELAEALGLSADLGKTYGALSGGQQRRALVASALLGSPALCLLDEPTSGVDIESRNQIWSALRERAEQSGMGVLVTTHDLVEAERHSDRVVVMRAGRIVQSGTAHAVITAAQISTVVEVRGEPATVRSIDVGKVAIEVSRAAADLSVGFTDDRAATDWVARVEPALVGARVSRRSPTLEDAYLVLAAKEDEA